MAFSEALVILTFSYTIQRRSIDFIFLAELSGVNPSFMEYGKA